VSKTLITHYSAGVQQQYTVSTDTAGDENPLHIACEAGAHEVVELLLAKGAPIDQLNKNHSNCLDIAINKGHREVVRVLLSDKNWHRLNLNL
jgi:ankyrin repeat protein